MSSRGRRAAGDRTRRPQKSPRDCVVFGLEEKRLLGLMSRWGTPQGGAEGGTMVTGLQKASAGSSVREPMAHSWDTKG